MASAIVCAPIVPSSKGELLLENKSLGFDQPSELRVFPNPASAMITITRMGDVVEGSIKILDMLGREVWTGNLEGTLNLDISSWNAGVYHVQHDSGIERFLITPGTH